MSNPHASPSTVCRVWQERFRQMGNSVQAPLEEIKAYCKLYKTNPVNGSVPFFANGKIQLVSPQE